MFTTYDIVNSHRSATGLAWKHVQGADDGGGGGGGGGVVSRTRRSHRSPPPANIWPMRLDEATFSRQIQGST